MRVTGWKGTGVFGIRIGAKNVAEHFSRHWDSVEITVGGKSGTFQLRETFWTTCPELRGGIIQRWLLETGLAPWPKGKPPILDLISLDGTSFRLTKGSDS